MKEQAEKQYVEVKGLDGKPTYFIEVLADQNPKDPKDTLVEILVCYEATAKVVTIGDIVIALAKAARGNINL